MSRFPTAELETERPAEPEVRTIARDDKGRLYCTWCCFRIGNPHDPTCPEATT